MQCKVLPCINTSDDNDEYFSVLTQFLVIRKFSKKKEKKKIYMKESLMNRLVYHHHENYKYHPTHLYNRKLYCLKQFYLLSLTENK